MYIFSGTRRDRSYVNQCRQLHDCLEKVMPFKVREGRNDLFSCCKLVIVIFLFFLNSHQIQWGGGCLGDSLAPNVGN